jgi:hypothetical protein
MLGMFQKYGKAESFLLTSHLYVSSNSAFILNKTDLKFLFQFRVCDRQHEVGDTILERVAVDVLHPIRRNPKRKKPEPRIRRRR